MTIFLTGDLDDAALVSLQQQLAPLLPGEQIHVRGEHPDPAGVDVAVVANPAPGALAGFAHLRLIQSLWAGVDRLLADASLPPQVPLARMVDPAMTAAMVQTGVWAVLSLQRDFFTYARQQQAACWRLWPQRRASECRVLILGLGEMGRALAQQLLALGYPVSAWRARAATDHVAADAPAPVPPGVRLHVGAADWLPALAEADVLVNLLPLTPATRGLLDARCFAALPEHAALVNLARGGHVVEADLLQALDSGHLSHAVLDVFRQEPLPASHRFWSHPGVTVLPHAAAQTDARSAAHEVALNVQALRAGRPLRHLVSRARGY